MATVKENIINSLTWFYENLKEKYISTLQIDGVSFNGETSITHYGECTTEATDNVKIVTCDSSFELVEGARISVRFLYSHTTSDSSSLISLNVNGTGAKNIAITSTSGLVSVGATALIYLDEYWRAGEIVEFIYAGYAWLILNKNTATTDYYGMTKLNSSVSSTSTYQAATPSAVKQAYDLADTANTQASTNAESISDIESALENKVDTEEGKGLSSNDFSDTYLSKLEGLSNYTHPSVAADDTTSSVSPTYGESFDAIDTVTRDEYGHVTGVNIKTVNLPDVEDINITVNSTSIALTDVLANAMFPIEEGDGYVTFGTLEEWVAANTASTTSEDE